MTESVGSCGTLRQAQQGFPSSARCQICATHKTARTKQDRAKLWCLAHLLTQCTCLGIGMLHLRRCVLFRYLQGRAEGDIEGHAC